MKASSWSSAGKATNLVLIKLITFMKISTCRFLLLLLSLLPVLSWGQTTVYWTAATSRDWNVATNWSPSAVPTATSNVVIGYSSEQNSPIIQAGTAAVANSVQLNIGALLTIASGGSITIDGATTAFTAGLLNNGTIENSGIIRVEPAENTTIAYGLYMQGTAQNVAKFINKSGGEIHIDGTSTSGIFMQSNSLFSNEDKGKVVIGENKTIGKEGVFNLGSVENKNGGEIYIYKFTSAGVSVGDGSPSFTNAGKVVISGTGTSLFGVDNGGSFTNQLGGEIYIDGTGNTAFSNSKNTFTNDGKVVMGANAAVGRFGVSNSSSGVINNNGEISIDRFNTNNGYGIFNTASFTNQGKVVIGANSSTLGVTGLNNTSSFLNKSGGEINIDRISSYGLANESSGTFTNEGNIQIGANGASGTIALVNNNAIFNNTGGRIFLDRSSSIGIFNFNSGTINNTGKVVVGANNGVGNDGVYNSSSTFNNNLCGELRVMRGRLRNESTLTNKGMIYVANSLTTQGTFTNEGVLSYGSLTGSVTNTSATSVIVNNSPTTPIFSYGGTYSGTINIFTDEAATQSAGTFSLPNNFTPLASFSTGTRTLYAKITPSQAGCTFVVPFSYLVCNSTLTAGATANPTTCGGTQGSIVFSTTNLPDGDNYVLSFTTSSTTSSPKSVNVRGNSFTLSGLTAGDYSNFSLSALGCSFSHATSKVLVDPPLPTVTIVGNNGTICAGKDAIFTVNGTSGATLTYVITGLDDDQTLLLNGTNQLLTVNNAVTDVIFSPISVSKNNCLVVIVDGSKVMVNPLPTATISGTATVCQNGDKPLITFTGDGSTAPYTFTYKLNNGDVQTITTENGNSVSLEVSTSQVGEFGYNLVKVTDASTTACSQTQTSNAVVTVNPLPTATVTGTTVVCQKSPRPKITFTGGNGAAPYTFTYTLNNGSEQTLTTENGNSITLEVSTSEAGTFKYDLVKVTDASAAVCSQSQTGSATVTVNPLPTATITGTTAVCQNSTSPSITFTADKGTAPYTFTYKINDGVAQTVTTTTGNSATVSVSTGNSGVFVYSLVSVLESSSTACSEIQTASVVVTVNPLPTATIFGATTVCQNSLSPSITFTGANATAPYTFTYKINDGAPQTVKTVSGNSVTVPVSTTTVGEFTYTLLSVSEISSTGCSQVQSGSVVVKVQGKPTITLSTLQQTLNEGNSQTFCDIDANPVNSLQFNVSGLCVSGSPVWRVQVGSGAWSNWTISQPVTQPSNNQPHRYQAACDANCPSTYTSPIELTINNRASVPQNVSLLVDGVTVLVGESKEVCSLVTIPLTFNANCAAGEVTLYSVDGGEYSSGVPTGLVDNQFHNYRVRCRKSDGTPSCVESESGVMRLKLVTIPSAPTVSLSSTSSCDATASFSGLSNCGSLRTVWYNATTNVALPNLPSTVPSQTTSYYARCQTENGCVSEKSNVVTFTLTPTQVAPVITASQEIVCTGTSVTISANCPAGSQTFWNTGVTTPSFEVSFNNVTKQTYWAKCIFAGGCQSSESTRKDIYWNAFVVTLINVRESKSSVKVNDRSAWTSQFIKRDGGPELEQSTQVNPTLYFVENVNKVAPRYWTINVEACGLSTDGSLTFDMLATPEMGVIRSFNTHENNAPYFMYANREGWTELYAQNHPAYGFYQDNGAGGNVYDSGLPKGLYKLGIRYWDMKGWGSIYPSTRKPQGNVLAYQEYWFRIQSKDGVGVGAARTADSGEKGAANLVLVPPLGRSAARGRGLLILPNPVTNILRLQVQDRKGQEVKAILLDAAGREVLSRKFVPETNMHHEEFGVSLLANGLYFLQVQTFEQQATLKVVKNE